jgi:hypothetical protein
MDPPLFSSSPSNDNSVLWRTLPKGSFFSHLSEWRIPQRGYFFLSLMGFKPMIQSSSMSTKQTNALSHLEQTWRFAWRHAKKEKIFFLYDLSLLAYYIKLILSRPQPDDSQSPISLSLLNLITRWNDEIKYTTSLVDYFVKSKKFIG